MDEKKNFEEFIEKILKLAEEKRFKDIREALLNYNAADTAEVIEEILEYVGIDEAIIVFRLLPKAISVDVFSYLPSEDQVEIINRIIKRFHCKSNLVCNGN